MFNWLKCQKGSSSFCKVKINFETDFVVCSKCYIFCSFIFIFLSFFGIGKVAEEDLKSEHLRWRVWRQFSCTVSLNDNCLFALLHMCLPTLWIRLWRLGIALRIPPKNIGRMVSDKITKNIHLAMRSSYKKSVAHGKKRVY